MKTSKYNYFISQESGKMLVFNGRTKRFFEVSERNATAFRDIIKILQLKNLNNTNSFTYECAMKGLFWRMR